MSAARNLSTSALKHLGVSRTVSRSAQSGHVTRGWAWRGEGDLVRVWRVPAPITSEQ